MRAGAAGATEFQHVGTAYGVAWLKNFWRMRSASAGWRADWQWAAAQIAALRCFL